MFTGEEQRLEDRAEEYRQALYDLYKWATGPDRTGNPYCKEPVRKAGELLGEL
jgi:hypothetical protein